MAEKEQAHERRAAGLLRNRRAADRRAAGACRSRTWKPSARAAGWTSQVKESGAIEQRIAQAEKESQELGVRLERWSGEIARAPGEPASARRADRGGARPHARKSTSSARLCRRKVREREKAIEAGRQVILRLLGEASTLKNQLAQIEEYLAGIEREDGALARARSRWPRRKSSGWKRRASSSPKPLAAAAAGTGSGDRRAARARKRTWRRQRQRGGRAAARRSTGAKSEVSQMRARKESLEQVLAHRTYTTESVKRLFAALEKGKAGDLKPLGVLADYVEVDAQYRKAGGRIPARRAGIRGGGKLAAGRARAGFHPRASWTGGPRSWCIRSRTATARRICRSRPSARRPASPRG